MQGLLPVNNEDKKQLSEADIKAKFITPALVKAGWDEVTSLSAAAQKALQNIGLNCKAVQGPMYWKYEDETLGEHRYRMETED